MKNKIIALFAALIIAGCSCVPALAATHTVYDNLNESSSQANILINAMLNQQNFNPFYDWFCWREGQNDYRIAYYVSSDSFDVNYIRYYNTGSGTSSHWVLSDENTETNFFLSNTNNYVIVGNTAGTISSSIYRDYLSKMYLKFNLPFLTVVVTYSIFKIRKGKRSYGC